MAPDWDAVTYERIADPQFGWGAAVVERLELEGDETVLDAGCGPGRVTELLLDRLPRGRVVALDGSPAMIGRARERLRRFGDRARFLVADVGEPIPLAEPVDAIVSTATFHWVPDHDALFRNLAAVLRPGGQLVAQCGGAGNLDTVVAALRDLGATRSARRSSRRRSRPPSAFGPPGSPMSSARSTRRRRRSRTSARSRPSCARARSGTTWRRCPRPTPRGSPTTW